MLTGAGKVPPQAFYMSSSADGHVEYSYTHSHVSDFIRVSSSSDVTADNQANPGDDLSNAEVRARVVQKLVTVVGPSTTTALGDPGAPDALLVVEAPGEIGRQAAGRYEVALPAVGGNRDQATATDAQNSRLVDNDGALYPRSGAPLGKSPAKQSVSVSLASLPAGVEVSQSAPERQFNANELLWSASGNVAQTPLSVRLELTRASGIQAATNWVFAAGVVIALGVSAGLFVVDRVFAASLVQVIPRRGKSRPKPGAT